VHLTEVAEVAAEEGGKDEHHQEGLPGVAGAVQATLNSKPIAALLTPAAEVFGDYFKQRAAAKIAEWEEKRRANVREHRRRAEYLSGQELPGDATEFQARIALEWADHVQNVDPVKDDDLSALWESVFAKIAANDRSARRYVDIIKQLEPEDAAALLSPLPYRFTRDTEMRSSDRLISADLLARSRTFVPNFPNNIAGVNPRSSNMVGMAKFRYGLPF